MRKFATLASVLAMFLMITGLAYADLNDGLVAYYPFNANADDESSNWNHATLYGTTFTEDKFGNPNSAISLDGIDDYIYLPVNINPDVMPQLTMVVWAKTFSECTGGHVITHDDYGWDREISWDYSTCSWWALTGHGVLGIHPVTANEWTFLAVVYDQNTCSVRFYVNDTMYEESGCTASGANYVLMGYAPHGETTLLQGILDEVRIYNRALSETEIQDLYYIHTDIDDTIGFFDESVADDTLQGNGPGNSADNLLNALRNKLETARDLIDGGWIEDACAELDSAYKKTDGLEPPPDFVKGDSAEELAAIILETMANLGCE